MQSQIDLPTGQCVHCKQALQKNVLNLHQEYYLIDYQPCTHCSTVIDKSNTSDHTSSTQCTPKNCTMCTNLLQSPFLGYLCTQHLQKTVKDASKCEENLQENQKAEGNLYESDKVVGNEEFNMCHENRIQPQHQHQAYQNSENEPQRTAAEKQPHLNFDATEQQQTAISQTISSNIQQLEKIEQEDAMQQQTLEQNSVESSCDEKQEDEQKMCEIEEYEDQFDSEYPNDNPDHNEDIINEEKQKPIFSRSATSYSFVEAYECVSSQQLFDYLEDSIRNLAQKLVLSKGKALFLLSKAQFSFEYQDSEIEGRYSAILYGDVQSQEFQNLSSCYVCGVQLDQQNSYALQCAHAACKGCWRQYLQVKINNGYTQSLFATCMVEGCTQIVDLETFTTNIPDGLYWYQKFLIQVAQSNSKRTGRIISCPKVGCDSYLLSRASKKQLLEFTSQSRNIQCHSCQTFFCNLCSEEAHLPVSCEQRKHWYSDARIEDANERLIRSIAKPCPFCGQYIQKIDNCIQIICHCLNEFCYECLQEFQIGVNHHSHFDCNSDLATYSYIDIEFEMNKNKLFNSLDNVLKNYDNLFKQTFYSTNKKKQKIKNNEQNTKIIHDKSPQSMDFLYQTLNLITESFLHLKYAHILQYYIKDQKKENMLKLNLEVLKNIQQKLQQNMEINNYIVKQMIKDKYFGSQDWRQEVMHLTFAYNNCFKKILMDSEEQINEQLQDQSSQDLQIREQQIENYNQFQQIKLHKLSRCIECYTRQATDWCGRYCDGCYARKLQIDYWDQ